MKCLSVLIFAFLSISVSVIQQYSAQEIIDKTIDKAGGDLYDQSVVHFVFRGKQYRSEHKSGEYSLERITYKQDKEVHDIVNNQGLSRTIESCKVTVPDSMVTRISDGVNSVHYFAYLPYGLNAPAVNKELVGEVIVKKEPYYKIKVTFDQDGGGTDFEDEFLYWIHKTKYTVDYLAYKYTVNGGGIRFREAYNPRNKGGIRFVDYNNYKTSDLTIPLSSLDILFEKGKLKLLSKIELHDIHVYTRQVADFVN